MTTVVLFDDERSFVAGFRDQAIIVKSVYQAEELFPTLKVIDELWLDFVLSPGSTIDAFHALSGVEVKRVIFHSSAYMARSLVESNLQRFGINAEVEFPPDTKVFV